MAGCRLNQQQVLGRVVAGLCQGVEQRLIDQAMVGLVQLAEQPGAVGVRRFQRKGYFVSRAAFKGAGSGSRASAWARGSPSNRSIWDNRPHS